MSYHYNPKTGKIGKCSAKIKCEFLKDGDDYATLHYDDPYDARIGYEIYMSEELERSLASSRNEDFPVTSQNQFSEAVLADVDDGKYADDKTGIQFIRDSYFTPNNESWIWNGGDVSSDGFAETVFDDKGCDTNLYDQHGNRVDSFRTDYDGHTDQDALEFRAGVFEKASAMTAKHLPEYAKGNERTLELKRLYRNNEMKVSGIGMYRTSYVAPEEWESQVSDHPDGVEDVSVRVRHGVATARVSYSDGTSETLLRNELETRGGHGPDGSFNDDRVAGEFFAQFEKHLDESLKAKNFGGDGNRVPERGTPVTRLTKLPKIKGVNYVHDAYGDDKSTEGVGYSSFDVNRSSRNGFQSRVCTATMYDDGTVLLVENKAANTPADYKVQEKLAQEVHDSGLRLASSSSPIFANMISNHRFGKANSGN